MISTGKVAAAPPGPTPAASAAGILRGVALQAEPRALVRRKDSPEKPREALALRSIPPSPRNPDEAYRDGLRQGHEKGYQEAIGTARQEAQRSGYEQGLQQGLIEGRASGELEAMRQAQEARETAALRLEQVDRLLASFSVQLKAQLASRLESAEDDMVALCHEVVCRILGAAALDRGSVAQMVRQATAQWLSEDRERSAKTPLTIGVHRDDLSALQADSSLATWFEQHGVHGVRWQADAQVQLGGCVVMRGAEGSVDARLETQLAALREVLLAGRNGRADEAGASRAQPEERQGLS